MPRCWLCGSGRSTPFLSSTLNRDLTSGDLKITDSHYGRTPNLVKCSRCGFCFADPLPATDLLALYQQLVDSEYLEGSEGRIRPFRWIIDRCLNLTPGARELLDIGAGTGLMCLAAQERGLRATGVEPSDWAVSVARDRNQVDVRQGTFPHPELIGRRFDLITLIDVVEHVTQPMGLLRQIASALVPGGLLVVTTPDVRSIAARLLGRRWWHFRAAHVCFFNPQTMRVALGQAGLQIARVENYGWCFPLGYLSERLERYIPVGGLRRAVVRTRVGQALFRKTVGVNLLDSKTFYARKPVDPGGVSSPGAEIP